MDWEREETESRPSNPITICHSHGRAENVNFGGRAERNRQRVDKSSYFKAFLLPLPSCYRELPDLLIPQPFFGENPYDGRRKKGACVEKLFVPRSPRGLYVYIIWKDPNDDSQVAFPANIFATRIFPGKGQKRERKGVRKNKTENGKEVRGRAQLSWFCASSCTAFAPCLSLAKQSQIELLS